MELERENAALRERLSRLSEASLRINESLDFNPVLNGALDSARSLTGARYGVITLLDDSGRLQDFLSSGMTAGEAGQLWDLPEGMRLFEYLGRITAPLRLPDLLGHIRSMGLPELRPPLPVGPVVSFLAAPILHRGERAGNIFVAEKESGEEFTPEDEETLVLFASQAALVIANARRYRDEQRARTDLETLINTSPVGVAVFDARTGVPVSFNREATRIVEGLRTPDQSPEQLLEILTLRRGDGREVSLEEVSLAQAMSTGETVRAEEIVIQVPDGRSVTTLVNATPIHSEEGAVESFVVTLQDLTPLEEPERLRAEFLSMVSHELRAPLTSIKGSVATVLGDPSAMSAAEMVQFFRIINHQADHMSGLIKDLLDVARIETGTLRVDPEPTSVAGLVEQARNTFLSSGAGTNMRIELAPDLPQLMADRRRLVQVLGNLLSNAARHSPETAPILVSAVGEGVHVAVSVTDRGRGVSTERLPHLFRKFPRLDGEDGAREIGGSGLGLAICKGIVEAHGGRIWAESGGSGQGTRFTFTIPTVEVAGSVAPAGSVPTSARRGQSGKERTRILMVDDDPQTLRTVRDALSKAGYAPIATSDPEEVSRLMEEHDPHLVLLDLVLPGVDGIELMQGIFENADVPVIFLSAYGQDKVIAQALDAGADDYVVKPFSPTELAARVRTVLRRRAAPGGAEPTEPCVLGDLTINYAERQVTVAGRPVRLTDIEYRLLVELSLNADRVATYEYLLQRVWGSMNSADQRPVRSAVKTLRRKLGDNAKNPTYLFNESRVGYRLGRAE